MAAGGLGWLAKLVVIIATDGAVVDEGAAAVFYLLGLALMIVGSMAGAVLLTYRRSRWIVTTAALLSPAVYFAAFIVLDGLAKALVGDRGPAYLRDEAGILATDIVALLVGTLIATRSRRHEASVAVLRVRESAASDTVMTP
jgi:general stress protein CsbA